MTGYWSIVDQLDMYCCPRCMAVAYGDPAGWDTVIVNDLTDLIDIVCPDCITEYDLTRPELAQRLAEVDQALTDLFGGAL